MVTEYRQNGMVGFIICTTTIHCLIATLSTIHFSKSRINGSLPLLLLECTYQRQRQYIQGFCNTEKAGKTSSQQSGLQSPEEDDLNDLNKLNILSYNIELYFHF
jgi:hypothetical protein